MPDKDILLKIAEKSSKEEIDSEEMGAMLSVLQTGMVLQVMPSASQKQMGIATITNVTDSEGATLVAGKNYLLRDAKVKVLREEFGSGNFLDTYYRVYYLDSSLEETFTVVDVAYKGGPFGKRVYQSQLKAINKK